MNFSHCPSLSTKYLVRLLVALFVLASLSAVEVASAQDPASVPTLSDEEIETRDQVRILREVQQKKLLLREAEEELGRRRDRLGKLEQDVLRRYKALRMLQEELSSSIKRTQREEDDGPQDTATSQQRRAERAQEVRKLAKSFESMKPAAAAKVIEVMEDELVVDVLRVVSPRKSGKILGALEPKTAARVSEMMTSMRRRR